jgi:hypothetical protein
MGYSPFTPHSPKQTRQVEVSALNLAVIPRALSLNGRYVKLLALKVNWRVKR